MTHKSALVFPGQGSQRVGMLHAVPLNPDFERLLDAAEALSGLGLRSVAEGGPDVRLSDTRFAQPLLYLADWAWGVALLEGGVRPAAVAGHSLGELAALAIAGVFSVEAGLELVVERSALMAEAAKETDGTMAAVLGLDSESIASAIDGIERVWVANDNAPGQVVITGTTAGVVAAVETLQAAGARRIVPLNVAGPFHSPLMEGARSRFADVLATADFADAWLPVYQNTDPTAQTSGAAIRERLIGQITAPVRWTETMRAFVAEGIETLVEAGPGNVLTGLTKKVDGLSGLAAESIGIERTLEEVL